MRKLGRLFGILLLVLGVAAGLAVADEWIRRDAERQVSATLTAELGGQVSTELGGWPFVATRLTNRLTDARVTVTDATLPVGDRTAEVQTIKANATGLSPVDDPAAMRAEQLDAQIVMTWRQLTTLVGFPVGHVRADRVSARASVEVFGVVAVIELQADLSVGSDGSLLLENPTASAAGVAVPDMIVQLAVDSMAPELRLPSVAGMSYEGITTDSEGLVARLHGTDVLVNQLG